MRHKTVEIDGIDIFYRESGDPKSQNSFCCTASLHRLINIEI
jgi:hypothetical protein